MRPLPTLLLCALSGHLLARLRDAQAQAARTGQVEADLAHTLTQNARLRRELETTRANLTLTTQAFAQTSRDYQHLLQSRPKPAPKPGQGGFKDWNTLGVDMPRKGHTLDEIVATPLDPEAGA